MYRSAARLRGSGAPRAGRARGRARSRRRAGWLCRQPKGLHAYFRAFSMRPQILRSEGCGLPLAARRAMIFILPRRPSTSKAK